MNILVFIDVLNRGRLEESDQEDEHDATMLRIVDWTVRRWRDLHPGVLWASLMLRLMRWGSFCLGSTF
ncbi:hypothetical protein KFL_000920175 [Klebsormidium nitens]|uniref:Uncharacterized protein n=1 Tax=Klebsormidium nitens TaxID=105231 RepID=A0A0U9HR16_KLENI|nr:hypothetical protein KFL_000920175 [Klebsormidium nitens]|eukprot:GAQ81833.1 hypothetical protein KFL_000920175 [Klebsormidium nitens]